MAHRQQRAAHAAEVEHIGEAPAHVAAGLLDGLLADEEDIFPDPNAHAMARPWWSNPKAFERGFSGAAAA